MKLEIKHLSVYLPYGLKFKTNTGWCTLLTINYDDNLINESYEETYDLKDIKPILRPLSDLYKEDLNYLVNNHSTDWFADTNNEYLINDYLEKENLHHYIEFLPFGLVQWFIENHYDIFGLIEKGLAINVNTL